VRNGEIGSVVEAVKSLNPHSVTSRPITYLDLSSVDSKSKLIVAPTLVASSEAPSRARQLVSTGDVLVSTVRPNLNAVALVPPELDGATASTGFCVLRPREGQVDGRYLFHWVRTRTFISEMERLATGASYPAVSDKIIHGANIPLPSVEEQQRIASILDAADELRTKRRQALTEYDTLTQAIFIDMFGDPSSNRDGGPVVQLGELMPTDKSSVDPRKTPDQEFDLISIPAFDAGRPEIVRGAKIGSSKQVLLSGDVLLSKIVPHIRRACVVLPSSPRPVIGSSEWIVFRSTMFEPAYLREALVSDGLHSAFMQTVAGVGGSLLRARPSHVAKIKILLPALSAQRRFGEVDERLQRETRVLRESARHLEDLFNGLQHRAFRGGL